MILLMILTIVALVVSGGQRLPAQNSDLFSIMTCVMAVGVLACMILFLSATLLSGVNHAVACAPCVSTEVMLHNAAHAGGH